MTREQAKLAFLTTTSVQFPSGDCFDAGYDVGINHVLGLLDRAIEFANSKKIQDMALVTTELWRDEIKKRFVQK